MMAHYSTFLRGKSMPEKLLPYVWSHDIVPEDVMLCVLNSVESGEETFARRAAANAIRPEAGDYLSDWYFLRAFIAGELSDGEVDELISSRKLYIRRACELIPAIMRLLEVRSKGAAKQAINFLDDCLRDFPAIANSSHSKVVKRSIFSELATVKQASSDLLQALQDSWRHLDIEFRHHQSAKAWVEFHVSQEVSDIDDLKELLESLRFCVDLLIYKDSIGYEAILVSDNKEKTHIVECAYSLSLCNKKPPLVTTPGSEFSLLCGLIYELASGQPDVSLAGAINRFSRSEQRKKMDRDEAEVEWENSEEFRILRESDNFAEIKGSVEGLTRQREFWLKMFSTQSGNKDNQGQIALRFKDVERRIEEKLTEHGPFLVWANQASRSYWDQLQRQSEENSARILELQIEIGRLRRIGKGS